MHEQVSTWMGECVNHLCM